MGEEHTDNTGVTFSDKQQEMVDRLVGFARQESRDKITKELEAQHTKDEGKAEQAKLAANQEWEKLAKTHEARAQELEPIKEMIGVYVEFVDKVLEDRVKELGDKAKTIVAGLPESMTAMDKLVFLNANIQLFQESVGAGVGTPTLAKERQQREKLEVKEMTKIPLVR